AAHHVDVLGHRTARHAANHRHVVAAVDDDADQLAGRAVARQGDEAVADRLAGGELLDRGQAVVDGVGPAASAGEGKAAVGRRRRQLGGKARLALIDIADAEAAAGGEVAAHHVDVLGHRTARRAADHRHVVAAVDDDADQLAGRAVARQGGEAVADRLAGGELLDRGQAVVDGVGPAANAGEGKAAV